VGTGTTNNFRGKSAAFGQFRLSLAVEFVEDLADVSGVDVDLLLRLDVEFELGAGREMLVRGGSEGGLS
jgi:hypothetical protein